MADDVAITYKILGETRREAETGHEETGTCNHKRKTNTRTQILTVF